MTVRNDYDVVIVGASIAGCSAAILLGRAGARVALLDKRPDPQAFKRMCTHFIQSSALPTLERLGLLEQMEATGAQRTRPRAWSRWGWIVTSDDALVPSAINLRREVFDPMIRRAASEVPSVEPMLGWDVHALTRDAGRVAGVEARDSHGKSLHLHARLVIGADGRDSRVADLASVPTRTIPHGRFVYGAYFEGPSPVGAPDGSAWFLDPDWAAAFPTDSGLTFYAAMPTKQRIPEFRRDPQQALTKLISELPDAPPILASRMVGSMLGKLDVPNVIHRPTAPGLALIGDAALATDPLWGVGCGWALQSSEWLADSVAPALAGIEPMEKGLTRYRRRHARALRGHMFVIHDYTGARKFNLLERTLFAGAARDAQVAKHFEAFGSRNIGPVRMFASALPRAVLVNARHSLRNVGTKRSGAARAESA